jgi:hypothetical protein
LLHQNESFYHFYRILPLFLPLIWTLNTFPQLIVLDGFHSQMVQVLYCLNIIIYTGFCKSLGAIEDQVCLSEVTSIKRAGSLWIVVVCSWTGIGILRINSSSKVNRFSLMSH